MKIPDMWPNLGLLLGAVTMVTAVLPAQAAEPYVLGVCQTARQSIGVEIRPTSDGNSYLNSYHSGDARYTKFDFRSSEVKITLAKAPEHGTLTLTDNSDMTFGKVYNYMPNQGYVGQDRFVLLVEKNGVKVRIEYLIEGLDNDEADVGICDPDLWKISATTPVFNNSSLQARLNAVGVNHIFPFITNAVDHGWYIDYTSYLGNRTVRHSRGATLGASQFVI